MLGLYYSTHIHKSPLCRPIVNSSIDQVCMGSQVDSPDHRSVKPYGLYNLWSRHKARHSILTRAVFANSEVFRAKRVESTTVVIPAVYVWN